jgi:putative transcriptional regulator
MTRFGDDLIAAMQEAVVHARGGDVGAIVHQVEIDSVDVRSIRQRAGLKQDQMAPLLGISLSGYRKWEQGKRAVSGPARALLTVMEREPDAVVRALFGTASKRIEQPLSRRSKTRAPRNRRAAVSS